MLTKKAFDDECIKHPDALSLTNLRYIFFVLVFAFGYSAADIWASRQALRMFLLEATHVGNIDPTYFVSIQATSSGSGSVLFAHHSATPPARHRWMHATLHFAIWYLLSAIYSTCILDLE